MKIRTVLRLAALVALSLSLLSCKHAAVGDKDEVAVLETNYGRIVIEFYPDEAPKHVANFKELARERFYDGTKIHRLAKDKANKVIAIQGGDPNTINGDPSTWGMGQPDQKTVPAEFSKTLKHERGTLSAARKAEDVNSASSQFFICVAPNPQWDGQYTIYGRVIQGMNVVDAIARAPMIARTEKPADPVVVNRVYITKRSEVK